MVSRKHCICDGMIHAQGIEHVMWKRNCMYVLVSSEQAWFLSLTAEGRMDLQYLSLTQHR